MNATDVATCPPSPNAYDPDVAGVGFVVAFYTTALVNIFAVLAAYLMGSLPDTEYTEIDILLISFIRFRSLGGTSRIQTRKALQRGRCFQSSFEKLLGNLADQQLAFSLCILVAVCSRWSQISLYDLEMAWTLATISLVTHMAAIRYCSKYIRGSRLLGTVRAGGIFIVLIGFISLMIVLEYAQLQAEQLTVSMTGSSAAAVAWRMQISCLFSLPIQTPPDLTIDIFWCFAALTYYVNILIKLKTPHGKIYAFSFVYRGLVYLLRGNLAKLGDESGDYRHIYKSRSIWIDNLKLHPKLRPLKIAFRYFAQMEAAYLAIKTSLSADMPWLFFVLIYCLAQLKTVWLDNASPFWDPAIESGRLGIGQIMALMLLTVLLLNAVDAFMGASALELKAAPIASGRYSDDIEAAGTEKDLGVILDEVWFRRFLFVISAWDMAVLIYAGIISGGPWNVDGLNISVVCLIASLFVWEVALELYNLIVIIRSKLK